MHTANDQEQTGAHITLQLGTAIRPESIRISLVAGWEIRGGAAGANPYYLTSLARLAAEQVDTMYQRLIQKVPGCEGEDGEKSHASMQYSLEGISSSRRADLSSTQHVPERGLTATGPRGLHDTPCSACLCSSGRWRCGRPVDEDVSLDVSARAAPGLFEMGRVLRL